MDVDHHYMQRALDLAAQAQLNDEVPVGAVLVLGDQVIGEGYNQVITHSDPTAHAEIVAMRQAATAINNYRLLDATLYVTLEPCAMCAGAIIYARVKRVVYGATDPKTGAAGSVFDILTTQQLNHQVDVCSGLLAEESSQLLKNFFRSRR